jgi:hypothetical protein
MKKLRIERASEIIEKEWVSLPGGELEAPRPSVLCPACRAKLAAKAAMPAQGDTAGPQRQPLCFACYRAGLERDRALKAAGELNTASEARFQTTLPFEPVDQPRLARLRQERATTRAAAQAGVGRYVDKRRQAQIAARHALERIIVGLRERSAARPEREQAIANATHAAELQLPEAWLPFVIAR